MSMYPPVRDTMIRLLSTPRLGTYTAARSGSVPEALELYRWNLDISMAFFESIHYFEVAFRNAIDSSVEKWYDATHGRPDVGLHSWLEPTANHTAANGVPARVAGLNGYSQQLVQAAIRNAAKRHTQVDHGHVVAQLTLGFWHHLVMPASASASAAQKAMWGRAVKPAFVSSVAQTKLDASVQKIVDLRNRIAHHEPIFDEKLRDQYANLLTTAEQIEPGLGWWIDTTSRVETVLQARP